MTFRTEVSGTETFVYTQTWTADNRLQSVIKTNITGTVLAVTEYAYDGDGVRVRKADPSGTTLYIGLTEVTLAYTPPAGMGNTGVSADGFDLRKRGATVGWDAGVFDGQHAITQTGFAQVRAETKYGGYRLFGLTTSDIGGGFCPTRYGLELVHGGTLEIYENCVRVAYPPALVYGAGDQHRIEADAGVVRYKRQVAGSGTWEVLYTSTLPVTAALYFNASLYTPGSTLKEIRFVSGSTGAPSVNRTYYTFGGARVAMRDGAGAALVYLHGDHLGSASLATSVTGTVVSQQRYAPYGEVRWSSGAGMPTDFTFTSQRAGPANFVGSLTDYVARFYSPALGRFISADTIVPGAGNPQAYNRYMYVLGNPLGYRDPSGHQACNDSDDCESRERVTPAATTYNSSSFIPPISDGGIQTQGFFLVTRVGDSQHVGVDTAPKRDPAIRASGNGIVVLADACSESECIGMIDQFIPTNNIGYGNVVVVEYPYLSLPEAVRKDLNLERGQSLFMLYAHLKDAPTLKTGSFVKTGQTLGTIGSTGNSTGPHLHHETRIAKTDALARGVMCSDSSCFATKKDGSPQYGTWRELPKFDPNTITYYVNPKARSLKVAD